MSDTARLLGLARAHMTDNYRPPGFVLERGEGSRVWDTDSNEYLDFSTGIGVNALGHGHPAVAAAVAEQAGKLSHTSNLFYHRNYIELCSALAERCFGDRVYLCNSGAEAIEGALKIARRYFYNRHEPRTEFVSAEGSFHGRTYGAISITGQPQYQEGFGPMLPGVRHVPFGDVDALERVIGPETAAVILEPIQGNSGVKPAPPGYLAAVRSACDAAGCLLVFDEVQTGFGRTGDWFAHQHDDVTPDLMTLAKALGGGLPLGALVLNDAVAETLKPGVHASTFGGNPVACAAGLATLRIIESERLLERACALGARFGERLIDHPAAREMRGRGAMLGVRIDGDAKALQVACRDRGLLVTTAGADVLRVMPPLNATLDEMDRACQIITAALVG